jgi:hypothetical protein
MVNDPDEIGDLIEGVKRSLGILSHADDVLDVLDLEFPRSDPQVASKQKPARKNVTEQAIDVPNHDLSSQRRTPKTR